MCKSIKLFRYCVVELKALDTIDHTYLDVRGCVFRLSAKEPVTDDSAALPDSSVAIVEDPGITTSIPGPCQPSNLNCCPSSTPSNPAIHAIMGKYSSSKEWEDVIPIPQDDGGPNPLAAIAYTEQYSEAMSYLRAVMADNESSERVLELTGDIIRMNPAHYTVWLYRASVVFDIKRDLLEELEWLNKVSLKHLKNYQIWYVFHLQLDPHPTPTKLSFSIATWQPGY